jgi:hypothetical protein
MNQLIREEEEAMQTLLKNMLDPNWSGVEDTESMRECLQMSFVDDQDSDIRRFNALVTAFKETIAFIESRVLFSSSRDRKKMQQLMDSIILSSTKNDTEYKYDHMLCANYAWFCSLCIYMCAESIQKMFYERVIELAGIDKSLEKQVIKIGFEKVLDEKLEIQTNLSEPVFSTKSGEIISVSKFNFFDFASRYVHRSLARYLCFDLNPKEKSNLVDLRDSIVVSCHMLFARASIEEELFLGWVSRNIIGKATAPSEKKQMMTKMVELYDSNPGLLFGSVVTSLASIKQVPWSSFDSSVFEDFVATNFGVQDCLMTFVGCNSPWTAFSNILNITGVFTDKRNPIVQRIVSCVSGTLNMQPALSLGDFGDDMKALIDSIKSRVRIASLNASAYNGLELEMRDFLPMAGVLLDRYAEVANGRHLLSTRSALGPPLPLAYSQNRPKKDMTVLFNKGLKLIPSTRKKEEEEKKVQEEKDRDDGENDDDDSKNTTSTNDAAMNPNTMALSTCARVKSWLKGNDKDLTLNVKGSPVSYTAFLGESQIRDEVIMRACSEIYQDVIRLCHDYAIESSVNQARVYDFVFVDLVMIHACLSVLIYSSEACRVYLIREYHDYITDSMKQRPDSFVPGPIHKVVSESCLAMQMADSMKIIFELMKPHVRRWNRVQVETLILRDYLSEYDDRYSGSGAESGMRNPGTHYAAYAAVKVLSNGLVKSGADNSIKFANLEEQTTEPLSYNKSRIDYKAFFLYKPSSFVNVTLLQSGLESELKAYIRSSHLPYTIRSVQVLEHGGMVTEQGYSKCKARVVVEVLASQSIYHTLHRQTSLDKELAEVLPRRFKHTPHQYYLDALALARLEPNMVLPIVDLLERELLCSLSSFEPILPGNKKTITTSNPHTFRNACIVYHVCMLRSWGLRADKNGTKDGTVYVENQTDRLPRYNYYIPTTTKDKGYKLMAGLQPPFFFNTLAPQQDKTSPASLRNVIAALSTEDTKESQFWRRTCGVVNCIVLFRNRILKTFTPTESKFLLAKNGQEASDALLSPSSNEESFWYSLLRDSCLHHDRIMYCVHHVCTRKLFESCKYFDFGEEEEDDDDQDSSENKTRQAPSNSTELLDMGLVSRSMAAFQNKKTLQFYFDFAYSYVLVHLFSTAKMTSVGLNHTNCYDPKKRVFVALPKLYVSLAKSQPFKFTKDSDAKKVSEYKDQDTGAEASTLVYNEIADHMTAELATISEYQLPFQVGTIIACVLDNSGWWPVYSPLQNQNVIQASLIVSSKKPHALGSHDNNGGDKVKNKKQQQQNAEKMEEQEAQPTTQALPKTISVQSLDMNEPALLSSPVRTRNNNAPAASSPSLSGLLMQFFTTNQ